MDTIDLVEVEHCSILVEDPWLRKRGLSDLLIGIPDTITGAVYPAVSVTLDGRC